jgi:4-hydroxy-tetrahydrodipicolinate synthase
LAGVLPVLVTPFHDDGAIDLEGLARMTDRAVLAGAGGIVYPTGASETEMFDASERRAALAGVTRTAAARVPVVAGVAAPDAACAVSGVIEAHELGAAAAMIMPPQAMKHDPAGLIGLLGAVADAAPMPRGLGGSGISSTITRQLLAACPALAYVKEETPDTRVTEILAQAPSTLRGVLGGAGGRHILGELARGVVGSIPTCESAEVHVAIHHAFRTGNADRARDIFDQFLPLLNFLGVYRVAGVKEVLRRRGFLSSAHCRAGMPLDRFAAAELEAIIERVQHLWSGPARTPREMAS